jgi:hypothetical protein
MGGLIPCSSDLRLALNGVGCIMVFEVLRLACNVILLDGMVYEYEEHDGGDAWKCWWIPLFLRVGFGAGLGEVR